MASYKDFSGKYSSLFDDFAIGPEYDAVSMAMSASCCDADDDCTGFCPECRQIIRCEAYQEIKEEWDSFYM